MGTFPNALEFLYSAFCSVSPFELLGSPLLLDSVSGKSSPLVTLEVEVLWVVSCGLVLGGTSVVIGSVVTGMFVNGEVNDLFGLVWTEDAFCDVECPLERVVRVDCSVEDSLAGVIVVPVVILLLLLKEVSVAVFPAVGDLSFPLVVPLEFAPVIGTVVRLTEVMSVDVAFCVVSVVLPVLVGTLLRKNEIQN